MPNLQTENPESRLGRPAQAVLTPDPWESAYLRFETPEEEIQKFIGRLNRLGAAKWPRDAEIVELFCGRGNGLIALQRLGFVRLESVDLSPRLIAQYKGSAKCTVADCRKLPFADRSKDVLIVQGDLHHLPALPEDLEQTFSEMQRVLRKDGPRHVRRALAHSVFDFRALRFGDSFRAAAFEQDGCVRCHDRARDSNVRAMAGSAREHSKDRRSAFRSRARIVRLGQMEFHWNAALTLNLADWNPPIPFCNSALGGYDGRLTSIHAFRFQ
jgi:SAM-dependent methyltransferase